MNEGESHFDVIVVECCVHANLQNYKIQLVPYAQKKTPAVLLLTLHSENKVSILKSKFHPEHNKYAYNEMCV